MCMQKRNRFINVENKLVITWGRGRGAREGLGLRGAATVRGAEKRQRRTAQARQWQPLSSRNVQWSPIHKNVRSVQHTPDTNVMQ